MNTTRKSLIISILILLSSVACQIGNVTLENVSLFRTPGEIIQETRSIEDVDGISLATQGDMIIKIGQQESLVIEAEDNIIENIETRVENGVLMIKSRNNLGLRNLEPINYTLTVKALDTINISSSGNIQAPDLQADQFDINLSSSGDLNMGDLETETLTIKLSSSGNLSMGMLDAKTLKVSITSSGDVDILGGDIKHQDISISSSGKYAARDMNSQTAEVALSSSGSATLKVSDQLSANISSSGDLNYIGTPVLNASTSSSGRINQIQE